MKLFSIALNSPNKMRRKRDRESGHECARGQERVWVRVSQWEREKERERECAREQIFTSRLNC